MIDEISMTTIQQNISDVLKRISTVAESCGRHPDEITLLAVSKTKPFEAIQAAIDAGQCHFGENYVQEGIEKFTLLLITNLWFGTLLAHYNQIKVV